MVRRGVSIISFPYRRMSMSIMRSWYVLPSDFVVRPSSCSISSVVSNSRIGVKSVSNATAQLRKAFLLSKPHGAVSMKEDCAVQGPSASDRSSIARVRFSVLLPMFVPKPRCIVVIPLSVNDEHRIAIEAEAVTLLECNLVCIHHVVVSSECCCQHQHC